MNKTMMVVSNNIPFSVNIVSKGDTYGLNNCLTHTFEDPLVEFYDKRYKGEEKPDLGQFISRYYMNTLLERKEDVGLNLQGGVPDWQIDKDGMAQVKEFLVQFNQVTPPKKLKM